MERDLKILFWGYDRCAEKKLSALSSTPGVRLCGVVIPLNRDRGVTEKIKSLAEEKGLAVFEPETLKGNGIFYNAVLSLKPDVFIVDAYTKIIPENFLSIPGTGAFNFHPGKLPEYRGPHVLNWAIINGEKEISLTVHNLNEKADRGEIFFSEKIEISFFDNINSLYDKICEAGILLLNKLITSLKNNTLKAEAQDEKKAKYFRARLPEDGEIDWNQTNRQIYNLIRALLPPWPGAFFNYNGKRIGVYEALPISLEANAPAGTITGVNRDFFSIATGQETLLITKADKMDFSLGEKL